MKSPSSNSPTPPANGLTLLPPSLRALAECGVERRFRKGALFIQQGEPGGPLFFIVRGSVRAYSARDNGEFTFGYYGPGSYIGEMSLDGGPRSANVIAEEPVLCRVVTRHTLEQCMARDPKLAFVFITDLIHRVRRLSEQATYLALDTASDRLIKLLQSTGELQPDGTCWLPGRVTHAQLAYQIGCSRTMVTRLLQDMRRDDIVRKDQGRWRLMRVPAPPPPDDDADPED